MASRVLAAVRAMAVCFVGFLVDISASGWLALLSLGKGAMMLFSFSSKGRSSYIYLYQDFGGQVRKGKRYGNHWEPMRHLYIIDALT